MEWTRFLRHPSKYKHNWGSAPNPEVYRLVFQGSDHQQLRSVHSGILCNPPLRQSHITMGRDDCAVAKSKLSLTKGTQFSYLQNKVQVWGKVSFHLIHIGKNIINCRYALAAFVIKVCFAVSNDFFKEFSVIHLWSIFFYGKINVNLY